ncbi:MAG: glycosyltransferase [Dehalococcoidia bacterium]|nr:glycosyltransferase [Dehalococcoidia bacterium]
MLLTPPKYFVGRRNSDIFAYRLLTEQRWEAPVEFTRWQSRLATIQANASYAAAAALWRTHLPASSDTLAKAWHYTRRLVWVPDSHVRAARPDVVFTLMLYPVNSLNVPMVLDVDFHPSGIPTYRKLADRLRYIPEWMVKRATIVVVRHEVSFKHFEERFPQHAHKGIVVPHILPACEPTSEDAVVRKFQAFASPTIKVLFVANESRVKGLPELLRAYEILKRDFPLALTVVSNFRDGPVPLPDDVRHLANITQREVYQLMAESHIFAMPAKRDSLARAFREAMAQGCALLAPSFTPHGELLGEYGATADPTSEESVVGALRKLAENRDWSRDKALLARKAFVSKYHHSVAAERYYEAFRLAAHSNKSSS